MQLSPEQLKKLQQEQWAKESGQSTKAKEPAKAVPLVTTSRPNPYLNIIRKDIVCLINLISEAGWSPIAWYRRKKYRESGQYRDFMEQHFGRNE